jgi:Bacterial Ig-like domain
VANSEVRNANNYGVLKLKLHPTGYDWQFVAVDGTEDGKTTDSGTGSCSGTPPPSPDTEPPTVESTIPNANEAGVAPTTNVTATFSEDMLASSITGKTFKLTKKGSSTKIAAAVSYDADIDTATL